MTWFRHKCWYCGHVSKAVVFIAGDSDYQCIERDACEQRRAQTTGTEQK